MLDCSFEQRKFPRHAMPDGVIVADSRAGGLLGQLIDIGLGGLAFRYIDMMADIVETDGELVILQPQPRIYVEGLPFRTVSDVAVHNPFSFSSLPIRRRSVAFGRLNSEHRNQLEKLIHSHTPPPSYQAIPQPQLGGFSTL